MTEDKNKVHVFILSDEDKDRLTKVTEDVVDLIELKCKNVQEKAFVLRILMETFEETQNCVVPFKNRYTEPTFNYQKGFGEE